MAVIQCHPTTLPGERREVVAATFALARTMIRRSHPLTAKYENRTL
jgi:hypothetical protein